MHEWVVSNADGLRLSFFVSVFVIMAVLEHFIKRRQPVASIPKRWAVNLSLVVVNSVILKLALPILAIDAALFASRQEVGLFNQLSLWLPLSILISILIMDMVIYWQHRIFHRIPLLWRLHRVHHTDIDLDVSSGARFHPIEIILSMLIKISLIVLLGVPAVAVVIFEITLNAAAMFNHANIKLSAKVDPVIRRFIVTPDMHRIHHSIHKNETHSNFGFFLSCWDRWFKSYTPDSKQTQANMTLGLENFREHSEISLVALFTQPFRNSKIKNAKKSN